MSGLFITFEGVEGCGKSTQIKLLQTHLEDVGFDTVLTREPGGTPVAERIRALLLDPENAELLPMAELLLYSAARAQHVGECIRPAMDAGKVVLCDRFVDSTTAYQGAGREMGGAVLETLHELSTGGLMPDVTFLLDLPVEVGLSRAESRGAADRLEQESVAFHQRVRDGFLALAQSEPKRIAVVDAAGAIDAIAGEITTRLAPFLESLS
jgi:dTMP kinase